MISILKVINRMIRSKWIYGARRPFRLRRAEQCISKSLPYIVINITSNIRHAEGAGALAPYPY